MNKHITITSKNINQGEIANPQNCAIARSLKDNIKNLKSVSVLADHIKIKFNNGKDYNAKMPKQGTNFIKRFDRGLPVDKLKLNLNFIKN